MDHRRGRLAQPDEIHQLLTPSGDPFALSRFHAASKRNHPVLLFHGLSGNHFLMDPHPAPSLARTLVAHGYDTWAIDLRWGGLSEKKWHSDVRGWDFDEYLHGEVPSAIDFILKKAGASQLHWIGHSLGGMLLYCHLMGPGAEQVRSGTAIASSLDFSGTPTDFAAIYGMRKLLLKFRHLPLRTLLRPVIPLLGRGKNFLETFSYWQENVEPEMARRIHSTYFENVPVALLLQLASIMEPGGFKNRDGSVSYQNNLAQIQNPILAITADRDHQCAAEAAYRTFDKLGSSRKEYLHFGLEAGHPTHYGHMDLLVGKRAAQEVFPAITRWLDQTD